MSLKPVDSNLFSLIKEGNTLAFHQLYNKHWERLYVSVFNILKDKQETEDVLHEVFTKVWKDREKLIIDNVEAYLYKSVRNNALLKIRSNKFVELNEDVIYSLTLPKAEENLIYNDLVLKIKKASETLPKRCKEIFFMSRFESYSILEISNHFNISTRTVENQLHIALKHIRTSVGKILLLAISIFLN